MGKEHFICGVLHIFLFSLSLELQMWIWMIWFSWSDGVIKHLLAHPWAVQVGFIFSVLNLRARIRICLPGSSFGDQCVWRRRPFIAQDFGTLATSGASDATSHFLSVSLMFGSVLLERGRMIRQTDQPISCGCSTVDILLIRWRQLSMRSHFNWHLKGYSADSSIRGYLSPPAWIAFSTSEIFTDSLPQTIVRPGKVWFYLDVFLCHLQIYSSISELDAMMATMKTHYAECAYVRLPCTSRWR